MRGLLFFVFAAFVVLFHQSGAGRPRRNTSEDGTDSPQAWHQGLTAKVSKYIWSFFPSWQSVTVQHLNPNDSANTSSPSPATIKGEMGTALPGSSLLAQQSVTVQHLSPNRSANTSSPSPATINGEMGAALPGSSLLAPQAWQQGSTAKVLKYIWSFLPSWQSVTAQHLNPNRSANTSSPSPVTSKGEMGAALPGSSLLAQQSVTVQHLSALSANSSGSSPSDTGRQPEEPLEEGSEKNPFVLVPHINAGAKAGTKRKREDPPADLEYVQQPATSNGKSAQRPPYPPGYVEPVAKHSRSNPAPSPATSARPLADEWTQDDIAVHVMGGTQKVGPRDWKAKFQAGHSKWFAVDNLTKRQGRACRVKCDDKTQQAEGLFDTHEDAIVSVFRRKDVPPPNTSLVHEKPYALVYKSYAKSRKSFDAVWADDAQGNYVSNSLALVVGSVTAEKAIEYAKKVWEEGQAPMRHK